MEFERLGMQVPTRVKGAYALKCQVNVMNEELQFRMIQCTGIEALSIRFMEWFLATAHF